MMDIREMRMVMADDRMLMCMTVSLARRNICGMLMFMFMLVMFIVGMAMGVLQRLMQMFMLMALGQMQPDPDNHAASSQPEQQRY